MEERAIADRKEADTDEKARRWELARDVVALQLKLMVEGIRDVVLGPIGLIAGLIGAFTDSERPARLFRGVLRGSLRFDQWLRLYGALERRGSDEPAERILPPTTSADDWLDKIERAVIDQYEQGGLTRAAKDRIDRLLDATQGKSSS